jgi:hypothetical protein
LKIRQKHRIEKKDFQGRKTLGREKPALKTTSNLGTGKK